MSTCSNCYNGCTEIVSDRCVKYTGIDVPVLGIKTGDSLSFVEQALITFLVSTLDGTGVKIDLAPTVVCDLVQKYLPTCKDLSIVDISKALVQAACDLQVQVNTINATLATLNADYTIGCLTEVTASSDTHAIVQAVITKLCQVEVNLAALTLNLQSNYSSNGVQLNNYIASYLASQNFLELAKDRMIPYAPQPYFGPLSNFPATGDSFDISGSGSGYWDKVYLCNGLNGTPDLRGRTLVGTTTGMGGGTFNPAVDPAIVGNPNYNLSTTYGVNTVTLNIGQLPNHTHVINTVVNFDDPGHFHSLQGGASGSNQPKVDNGLGTTGVTDTKTTGITIDVTATAEPIGGGSSHNNVQPSIGSYFIMYIP